MDIYISKNVVPILSSTQELGEDIELGFTPRALVQATMPHRDPGMEIRDWERKNGAYELSMTAGKNIGLPFGSIPRLIVAWAATEVVRKQERILKLGPSLSSFLEKLDIPNVYGKNKDRDRTYMQLRKLFSASVIISIKKVIDNKDLEIRKQFFLSENSELWKPIDSDEFHWKSQIELSEVFFKDLLKNIVPIDLTTLRLLKGSPLAIDIYNWLTDRLHRLRRAVIIPWDMLQLQFGCGYANDKSGRYAFKKNFKYQLNIVRIRYPQAFTQLTEEGVLLRPSDTHIKNINRNLLIK